MDFVLPSATCGVLLGRSHESESATVAKAPRGRIGGSGCGLGPAGGRGRRRGMSEVYRIAIVGSGPSGLSAAAHAAAKGLSHVLLEKTDHLSDTIFRYQKGKHVMATPPQLVLRSDCAFEAGKRETVLEQWNADAKAAGVNVRYKAEVKAITGQKGDFTLQLAKGDPVRAETVVLAIGTQGNPNLMRCEGGNLPHVQYTLDDPAEYIDEHIFVFGGGDA